MRRPVTSGRAAGLDFDLAAAQGAGDGATVAVLLHGRGSHKGDLMGLAPLFPDDWTVVTPQAPYAGMEWGYGPGWAWYRYMGGNRAEEETIERSLSLIDDFLAALPETLGFEPGTLVLGGFSQGGTMSVAFALSRPGRVTVALNFSGFVAASVRIPTGKAAAAATPIFWGHGAGDPAIPFEMAVSGRAALIEAGVPLVAKDYEIGHWIVPEEVRDAVGAVRAVELSG